MNSSPDETRGLGNVSSAGDSPADESPAGEPPAGGMDAGSALGTEAVIALPDRYKRHHMWWLVGLLVVALFGVMIRESFSETVDTLLPETVPITSTYNKRPSGYSGLFELATKMGIKTERWQLPYRDLDRNKPHGTLVIVQPDESLTLSDVEAIIRWVDEGNDLVYINDFSFRSEGLLLSGLGLRSKLVSAKHDFLADVNSTYPEAKMAPALKLSSEARLDNGDPICEDNQGPLIVQTMLGKGRCLVATTPSICSNEHLVDPSYKSNFQFMVNWLASSQQPVYFDEKCHGYSSADSVFVYLLRSPVGLIILQLAIILMVALASLNQRFGRPLAVSIARKISNLEFIDGLASTYQRAKARDTAWLMIFQPFKARLCKSLAVAPHEDLSVLADAWAKSRGTGREDCEQFLHRAQTALDKRHLTEQELLDLVSTCDQLSAGSPHLQAQSSIKGA